MQIRFFFTFGFFHSDFQTARLNTRHLSSDILYNNLSRILRFFHCAINRKNARFASTSKRPQWSKRNRDSIVSRIFTLSRRRTLPFSFRIDSKRAFVLFLSLSLSRVSKRVTVHSKRFPSWTKSLRILRIHRMCYAPFFVATSSLTGRGSSIEKKEGAGWAGTGGWGGRGGEGSSFSSPPPFPTCDPTEDRAVSTSLALFSTRHVRREEVKKWSGRAWKCTGAPWIPGEGRGGRKEPRGCLIFPRGGELIFFFLPSFLAHRRRVSDGWNGSSRVLHTIGAPSIAIPKIEKNFLDDEIIIIITGR